MKNVRKFYDCSTAHLPPKTAQLLESHLFGRAEDMTTSLNPSMQNDFGFLVPVPESITGVAEHCEALAVIMAFAMDAGCDYVRFDCDVPTIEYFADFSGEWK